MRRSAASPGASFSCPFRKLSRYVGVGVPIPDSFRPVAEGALVIFVGLTGVGKTSAIQLLREVAEPFFDLPDRRELTRRIVIETLSKTEVGEIPRLERYAFVRAFRDRFEGGMGEVVARLAVDRRHVSGLSLFDGLRGENEVAFALRALPDARFVAIDAPYGVRLLRLLDRGDPHDRNTDPRRAEQGPASPRDALPWIQGNSGRSGPGGLDMKELLSGEEADRLRAGLLEGRYRPEDVRAKVSILMEENRCYDPVATLRVLRRSAARSSIVLDSSRASPGSLVERIMEAGILARRGRKST